jgi:hypothetical protein
LESENPSICQSPLSFSLSSGERDEGAIEEEYKEWLTKKASQLPTPPTLIEEWLQRNYSKKSNRKQFQKYKASLELAQVPAAAIEYVKNDEQTEHEQRLATLNFWCISGDQARAIAAIAANPQWGLRVGADGVEVAT